MNDLMPIGAAGLPAVPEPGTALPAPDPGQTQGSSPDQAPAPAAAGPPDFASDHDQALARFEQINHVADRLGRVMGEVKGLMKLGDTISPEAVVKTAGRLVAGGEDPLAVAKLLAKMPSTPGPGLQAWIAAQGAQTAETLAKVETLRESVRHQLATSALRSVISASVPRPVPVQAQPSLATAAGVPDAFAPA